MKKQYGVTLLELIIALVIISIMVTLAVPSFGSFMRSNSLSTKLNNLAGDISLARLQAVKRSRNIVLCVSPDGSACTGTDWSAGWIVYADENNDGALGPADEILHNEGPAPSYLRITSDQFGGELTIAPRGRLATSGTFVICDGDDATTARALNLQVTGLGRAATDSTADSDTIVEDVADINVSCI